MKNSKWIGLLLMLVLVFTLVPSAFAADTVKPFVDVPTNQYYADPVSWAVESKVTAGTDATHFSPAATCTRGQIVTFLYRAAGEPKTAGKNPFVDVKEKDYYYNAVLWAVENKVTAGTDATHFSPANPCTRGQIVTFLYRAAGEPETKGTNPFKDVTKGAYYESAVLWAVDNEITAGMTKDTFGPGVACQRAHAVTFLYRYCHMAQSAYVLMNIPYADFYAAEGVADVDAVSSSTVKTFNQNMAAGSYHDKLIATEAEVKASSILGVTYPVYVPDMAALADCKEIKADDKAEITVAAGKSETTTKEAAGADLLFASGDYAYMVLEDEPNAYKTLSVDDKGGFSFSAVSESAKIVKGMEANLTYGGHYTAIAYTVAADELKDVTVNGIIVTAGGEKFALRHVEDIWRITSLGWNWDSLDGKGLAGKTITNVTYYIKDAEGKYQVLSYDVSSSVKLQSPEIKAEFADASTVSVSGIPADAKNAAATVKDKVGRGETATVYAENVAVKDGKIALTTPAVSGKTYTITVVSDQYADMSANADYSIPAYVLMNIPYADFYAAEGVADVDAVSSSTLNKTRTSNLAGGSYHKDPGGTDISGIIYPVYVEDVSLLDGLKEVKDTDSVTISVTNRGETKDSTFTGKEALFENEDYAYYMLTEEPSACKTMTKDAEGKLSFSAVSAEAKSGTMTTELTYGGHHTDITFKVAADELDQASTKVNAVVITAGGEKYALRHVYEIWRVTELGWNWSDLDGSGLGGKTITNVTYYVEDADGKLSVLSYDVNATLLKNPGEVTAAFADASTVALSGLPADMQNASATVKNKVGRGETATVYAENVAVQDGKIALATPAVEGQSYEITVVSDNYGDVSCSADFGNVG